ncbi:nucleotide pyrophosphohydrolase [Dubosiella newyorkensis]|uniref:Nucleotide pyrophosphohydrolase n=1 Tax=Dubosiella newyorkensis TaxID=1862672 RepID=A0A1U7NMN1_9FIRM|nr:nucleotide pyrophosphohydrolase [Dubosiella newyorkensis]OLU46485.1 hypothetical protein BO225_06135 [Dubosiella newyorkensis]
MKEVIEAIRQVNQERDWDQFHTPENLAKSIVIEAAELLECFQWKSDYDSKQEVEEEIADVLSYCLQLCDVLDLDPREIVLKKLEKTVHFYMNRFFIARFFVDSDTLLPTRSGRLNRHLVLRRLRVRAFRKSKTTYIDQMSNQENWLSLLKIGRGIVLRSS